MPQVGSKKFPYTPAGKAAAKKEMAKAGKKMKPAPAKKKKMQYWQIRQYCACIGGFVGVSNIKSFALLL